MLVSQVPALKEFWYIVAYSADITTKPARVRLLGDDYVIWRGRKGLVGAALDECPHRGSRLSQGWVENGDIVCPYHGWSFDPTGACTRIPQNDDDKPIPPRARALSVLVQEKYGFVWVCPGMPRANIPELPEAEDPSYTVIFEILETWNASAPRIIDNALDVSHVAWTHKNTIGDSSAPKMNNMVVTREGHHLTSRVTYRARVTDALRKNIGLEGEYTERVTNSELIQPFVFRDRMEYENGVNHVLMKVATPIDDENTLFCQFIARNDDPDAEKQAGIVALDRQIQDEDLNLLQSIRPEFPLEIQTEMHTRTDRMTVEYRRILAELASESSMVPPDRVWATPFLQAVRSDVQAAR
ncbi:aromatic ring-hydroxylating oxygenase subunit alpha [Microbacterium thalassium]|uniref:Phenylpropionate dioxygenase-like ring-hydroxylating dioxygenase large terminal subunit n=1 Tax=Microbacterium thalassium TaxID=362649 RepID=A0A7X0FN38_9MICO|nr:aromatic ring-hydroxylating dioxygenase subunit alpha [Microbacterium thalassium]MBB6390552.1 phenylpropionate dioxygenase-like ring-hydroxylating dioxygenase large terminal subunit [Microbacterium thalassium]GLK25663.1 vanillate O-demethylase oxygenase subunit [Microbacterium thalassium]